MEHPPIPSKTWELSLYELQRTPQEAITDSTEIAVSPRSLHSELMCPICLDMLKNTMTTKECLHRFCQECIITALRSGNKECPTCRKKLVSKRSLRPDPNFDSLISKIYPSRDEYEAHQERVLEKLKQHHNANAFSHSIEEGLRLQALNRAQRVRKQNSDTNSLCHLQDRTDDPTSGASTPVLPHDSLLDVPAKKWSRAMSEESADGSVTSTGYALHEASNDLLPDTSDGANNTLPIVPAIPEIELVFKPHPKEHDNVSQTRYIKTTANATGYYFSLYFA